jgi:hypothetical protein
LNLAYLVAAAALAACALRKMCCQKQGRILRAPHLAVRQQPGDCVHIEP